jgi:serine/threonine-protein kinase
MPLSASTHLGPYEILSLIGAGGMGEVYKARDTRLGRIVAIKQLKAQHAARFEQEARTIASLNHPHICQIYDIGPDYLVLEYIEGQPLAGPMAVDDAVTLGLQIAGALEEAHARGVLHRDLKPANIMITAKGAKLLDFGLAKLLSNSAPDATNTVEGTVLGTAAYMSPEQAQGKPLDERSDVFSFGAVLYETLSGKRAFTGDSMVDILSAVVRDEPSPLQTSPGIARIVMRCLRKNPRDRFQSVAELKRAWQQIAEKPAARQPSIAVLPFANLSADKEQEYFSDGLAEEIINALAHLPGIKVTARTSAFSFKGKNINIAQIANELGVEHVLEGSVRKSGSRVRVTAQLVNAADGFQLWSERYDRELNDIFAVQDEISGAIASVLQAKLGTRPPARQQYSPSVAAYEAYLKGRHYTWQFARESFAKGHEFYQEAIELDPGYALPHAALAEYYHIAGSGVMDAEEAIVLGRAAARKALELDPSLPEAHAWLGIFAVVRDFDWAEAARRFRLALDQEPVPPVVRHLYGYFYLRLVGRAAGAVEEHRRALEADPLNLIIRVGYAVSLRAAGQDAEASAEARKILDLSPEFQATYTLQAMDVTREPLPEALAYAEKGFALAPWNLPNAGLLAGLLERNGDQARARQVLEALGDGQAHAAPCGLAIYHFLRSEIDLAAEWMERAIAHRHQMVAMLLLSPPYIARLRTASRWPALAKQMNLPANLF